MGPPGRISGCGDGTFTRALATRLPDDSVIHALDLNAAALSRIPRSYHGTAIKTHTGDFTQLPWPFADLDGVLLANALHFVEDKAAFIRACTPALRRRTFLIVEYDTDQPNQWVPYPISRMALEELFAGAGYRSFIVIGTRPSIYHRAEIYAALIAATPSN
jgi:trans-aconitate methyltransferase